MVNGQFYHHAQEAFFSDTWYSESTHIIGREASEPMLLQPVNHPLLREAAYFTCKWCNQVYWGGIAKEGERARRVQAKKQRHRTYFRRVSISILILFVILGVVAWLTPEIMGVGLYLGAVAVMAIFAVLLPRGEYTVETLVIDANTGAPDDVRHSVKLC